MTVRELVAAFERVFGSRGPGREAPPRPGDAVGAFANVDRRRRAARLARRADRSRTRSPPRSPGREKRHGDPGIRSDPDARRLGRWWWCCSVGGALLPAGPGSVPTPTAPVAAPTAPAPRPLAGRVVVIDPGHQLGNHNYPRQINRPVPAGGFRKPATRTGTATRGGFPEATFTWRVARQLRDRLRAARCRVRMTRHPQQPRPLGSVRGRTAAGPATGPTPTSRSASTATAARRPAPAASTSSGRHRAGGWTDDIARPSRRLALAVRAGLRCRGLRVANYTAGGDGLDSAATSARSTSRTSRP